jgi:predicted RND superfamily exporter protein
MLWAGLIIGSALILFNGLRVDVSLEQLQKPSSESYQAFQKNVDIFGSDESLMLLIQTPDVWTQSSLKNISNLQRDIGLNVPHVTRINSVINIPIIQAHQNKVLVSTVFDPWPESDDDLKKRILLINSDAPGTEAIRTLVSKDKKSTLFVISLNQANSKKNKHSSMSRTLEYKEASDALDKVVALHHTNNFQISTTGQARLLSQIHEVLLKDMYLLPSAALMVSILALLMLFRRKTGVLLPALVIVLPITSTLALMTLTKSPIQIPTGMLPPSLVVISVAFCVHILTTFYSLCPKHHGQPTIENKRAALVETIEKKSKSLSMSMISTVIALLSFGLSDVVPVANVGLFGAYGIFMAYISVLLLAPIYLRLIPVRSIDQRHKQIGGLLEKPISRLLSYCYHTSTKHPKTISFIAIATLIASAFLASKITFSHKPSEWLPHDWESYKISQSINRQFNSMISVELLVDSGREGGVYDSDFLNFLGNIHRSIDNIPQQTLPSGLSVSLHSYLIQLQEMMTNSEDNSNLSQAKVDKYLGILRLVAPGIIQKLVNKTGRYSRIIIRVPTLDGESYQPGINKIQSIIMNHNADYKVQLAGQASLIAATYEALSATATISYILSFVLILIMMIVHMQSMRAGIIMMIPNLLPILIVIAMMELTHTPLDFLNIMIVTLSIGLVVDDTIHFSGHFKQHYQKTSDSLLSIRQSINDTGTAMIVTTLVLTLGWLVLQFSQFQQLGLFGLLTSAIMVLGLAADLLVAPALLALLYKTSKTEKSEKSSNQNGQCLTRKA